MEESNKTETETSMGEIKASIRVKDIKLTKQALISSPEFSVIGRDILKLVLDDDRKYTIAEVQKVIDRFKEGF